MHPYLRATNICGAEGDYGKTSILRAAQANMSRQGAIVLYVNAEASSDVGELVGEIVAAVAAQVFKGEEDGIQKACQLLFHLGPSRGFQPQRDVPC